MSAIGSRDRPGYGTRYDRYEPNAAHDQHLRNLDYTPSAMQLNLSRSTRFQHRFCETCQSQKPKGKRPAVKGWKCDDCAKAR